MTTIVVATIAKKVDIINQHWQGFIRCSDQIKSVFKSQWRRLVVEDTGLFAKERNGQPYKFRGISVRSILCLPMNGRMSATTNIMVAILVIWYMSDSCLESRKMTNRLVLGFHLKSVGCTWICKYGKERLLFPPIRYNVILVKVWFWISFAYNLRFCVSIAQTI